MATPSAAAPRAARGEALGLAAQYSSRYTVVNARRPRHPGARRNGVGLNDAADSKDTDGECAHHAWLEALPSLDPTRVLLWRRVISGDPSGVMLKFARCHGRRHERLCDGRSVPIGLVAGVRAKRSRGADGRWGAID